MTDSDAEWIDVDAIPEIAPPKPGPNRPPPRPRLSTPPSATNRPRRFPWDGDGYPKRPFRPRRPFDASDRMPPSSAGTSNTVVISVSVVSVVFFLALVMLLLYLLVLKKKLRKVERSYSETQFSLRVQDVAHLDVDDNSSMYVNTTDLQKLVNSIRIKNKEKPPPPVPQENNIPKLCNKLSLSKGQEIVTMTKPFTTSVLSSNSTAFCISNHDNKLTADTRKELNTIPIQRAPSCDSIIYSNAPLRNDLYSLSMRRPKVPPPPVPSKSVDLADPVLFNINPVNSSTLNFNSQNCNDKNRFINSSSRGTHSNNKSNNKNLDSICDENLNIKPQLPNNPKPKFQFGSKVNLPTSPTKKPLLPLLNVNIRPSIDIQQESSSPSDTIRTSSTDLDTPTNNPEEMSVKEKRTLIEKALRDDSLK